MLPLKRYCSVLPEQCPTYRSRSGRPERDGRFAFDRHPAQPGCGATLSQLTQRTVLRSDVSAWLWFAQSRRLRAISRGHMALIPHAEMYLGDSLIASVLPPSQTLNLLLQKNSPRERDAAWPALPSPKRDSMNLLSFVYHPEDTEICVGFG